MAPYQKYHLKWPWTPTQVNNLDDMLAILFKALALIDTASNTSTAPTSTTTIISSAIGPPGQDGQDGEDGAQGVQGIPGVPGAQGATGLGIPGLDGDDGYDGVPGPRGDVGATGPPGATGATGLGVPGLDGEDGYDGFPGPVGAVGPMGPTGPTGPAISIGIPGLDGEDGDNGYPGPPGPAGAAGTGGGSMPILVSATTTLSTGSGWVIPEAIEIADGISLEVEGGARMEITGPVNTPAEIYVARVKYYGPQILTAFSKPLLVVPAPGPNKIAWPLSWTVHCVETGYNIGRAFTLRYTLTSGGIDASQNDLMGPATLTTTSAHDRWFNIGLPTVSNFYDKNTPASGGGSPVNKQIVMLTTADMTTFGASSDYMAIQVVYLVTDWMP